MPLFHVDPLVCNTNPMRALGSSINVDFNCLRLNTFRLIRVASTRNGSPSISNMPDFFSSGTIKIGINPNWSTTLLIFFSLSPVSLWYKITLTFVDKHSATVSSTVVCGLIGTQQCLCIVANKLVTSVGPFGTHTAIRNECA